MFITTAAGPRNPAWADERIQVGIFSNKPIVYYEYGPKGLFVEVLNHIAEKEGWTVDYVTCELKTCLELLKANKLDLMTSVGENEQRLEHFSFSRESIWTFWGTIYTRDARINGILDLRDGKIGVRTGNKVTRGIKKLLAEFSIPAEFVAYDDYESAFEALAEGRLEAVAVNNTYAFGKLKQSSDLHETGIVFSPFSAYFAVSRSGGHQALLDSIDKHVKQMRADPDSVLHTFRKRIAGGTAGGWTAKKMGIVGAVCLVIAILLMAFWRYRSMVLLNDELKQNIASRKQAQEKLRESEEQFRLAMEANRDGLWDWNLETGEVYYSPGYASMLGYAENDLPPSVDFWIERLHPEDRQIANNASNDCIENRCDDFAVEFRLQAKDGGWRWILGRGMAVSRGDGGRALRLIGTHTDITGRKQMENALRVSGSKMRSIFRAAPVGIGVVSQRVFTEVNDRFCEMVGYNREELIGQSARMLYADDAEYELVGSEKYRLIGNKGTGTVETIMQHRDGGLINVLLSSTPLDTEDLTKGVTFTALDITRSKQIENDLRDSENKYRSMMESMKDPVYICSPDLRVVYMNPAMIERVGYNAVGERCHKAMHNLDERCTWCRHSRSNPPGHFEMDVLSPKDNRSYHVSSSPIMHADGSASKMTIFRDTTEMKRMEKQLQQAQKMETIGTLAGGIAHDFNNILFPMSGYTELLQEDIPADSPLQEHLSGIMTGVNRAGDLVKQILAFSRYSDRELKPVSTQLVVREVLKLVRSSLPSTIVIEQDVCRDCPLIMADQTKIHQVALNLVTNAYHAMEEDGGTLTVSLGEVALPDEDPEGTDLPPGRYVGLKVGDTGTGIAPEIVDRIFDPYFTTKQEGKGTGLGLAVVHGIVKDHGGEIRVRSASGQGTVFNVYLPAIQTEDLESPAAGPAPAPMGRERVLLVDDEEAIVTMLRQLLERLGYQVKTRTSSVEALELFRNDPKAFDLVIADMTMPNMTGDKLAREIMDLKPAMPIILCTGFSEKMSPEKAKAMGIRGLLMKPVVKKEMASLIRNVLDAKH